MEELCKREKMWDECSLEQRVEKLRCELRSALSDVDQLLVRVQWLYEHQHSETTGELVARWCAGNSGPRGPRVIRRLE